MCCFFLLASRRFIIELLPSIFVCALFVHMLVAGTKVELQMDEGDTDASYYDAWLDIGGDPRKLRLLFADAGVGGVLFLATLLPFLTYTQPEFWLSEDLESQELALCFAVTKATISRHGNEQPMMKNEAGFG